MFLKLPNTIEDEVVGKRVNRGGGYGLEIPVAYRFNGPEKLEMARKENRSRLKSCLLYTSPSPRDLSTSRMPSSA